MRKRRSGKEAGLTTEGKGDKAEEFVLAGCQAIDMDW
jgi:hypothetical protein